MLHTKTGSRYILRLEEGEEVMETLQGFLKQERILLGHLSALGGMEDVTVGLLKKSSMQYVKRTFNEGMEIAAMFGTITEKDDEPYLHIHVTVSDEKMQAFGGHFFEGRVFPTMEVVIEAFTEGHVGRTKDPDTGLILMDFA